MIFWRFLNREYLESFIIPINNCCIKNGIASTGHYCIEDGKSEHVRQLGNRFDQKRHQGLPAVDMLGKSKLNEMTDLLRMGSNPAGGDRLSISIPGTSSAAYFTSGSRTMCECFGLAGKWNLDLFEIKRITGLLAVLGIDLFVPHGIYYSIANHRKWEAIPDHFHNPIWEHYREWTDYTARICQLTAGGERLSQTALLYPLLSQQANLELVASTTGKKECGKICDRIDMTYRAAGNFLLENGIQYEILVETYLQQATIDGDRLVLRAAGGKHTSFRVLVLPNVSVLEKETVIKLRKWRENGGRVVVLNDAPMMSFCPEDSMVERIDSAFTADIAISFTQEFELIEQYEILANFINAHTSKNVYICNGKGKIVAKEWRKDGIDFCLLHNISRNDMRNVGIRFAGANRPYMLDVESVAYADIFDRNQDGYTATYDFSAAESIIVVAGVNPQCEARRTSLVGDMQSMTLGAQWNISLHKPNALPLNTCHSVIEMNTQVSVYKFNITEIPEEMGIALDEEMLDQELVLGKFFTERFSCYVNGHAIEEFVPGSIFDYWMYEADISPFLRAG